MLADGVRDGTIRARRVRPRRGDGRCRRDHRHGKATWEWAGPRSSDWSGRASRAGMRPAGWRRRWVCDGGCCRTGQGPQTGPLGLSDEPTRAMVWHAGAGRRTVERGARQVAGVHGMGVEQGRSEQDAVLMPIAIAINIVLGQTIASVLKIPSTSTPSGPSLSRSSRARPGCDGSPVEPPMDLRAAAAISQ